MKTLLIKFPTRSRPEKFKKVLQEYINNLSGSIPTRFVITMDNDDETMNTSEMREWLDGLIDRNIDLVYHYGDSKTKVRMFFCSHPMIWFLRCLGMMLS